MSLASLKTGLHTAVNFTKTPPSVQTDLVDLTLTYTPNLINENDKTIKSRFPIFDTSFQNSTVNNNRSISPNDPTKVLTPAIINADHTECLYMKMESNPADNDCMLLYLATGAGIEIRKVVTSDVVRISWLQSGFTDINGFTLGFWHQLVIRHTSATPLVEWWLDGIKDASTLTPDQTASGTFTTFWMNGSVGGSFGTQGGLGARYFWTRGLDNDEIEIDLPGALYDGNNFIKEDTLVKRILLGLV